MIVNSYKTKFDNLDMWVKMTILGLRANPNYHLLGDKLGEYYDEFVKNGYKTTPKDSKGGNSA